MRKLTGYIGAMIILFALMGSILAGYALNINGTNTVVNEYEKVTDVSGLYSHTQEPTYIDYNPASNYIGYSTGGNTYTNSLAGTGDTFYNMVSGDHAEIYDNSDVITITGRSGGVAPNGVYFVCDKCFISVESGATCLYSNPGYRHVLSGTVYININGTTTTVTNNGTDYTFTNTNLNLAYTPDRPDYKSIAGGNNTVYMNNEKQSAFIFGINNVWVAVGNTGINLMNGSVTTANYTVRGTEIDYGVYSYNIGKAPSGGFPVWTFYPMSVISDPLLGINYTESNRVNNYLMQTEYIGGTTTVTTVKLNLTPGMGLTDNSSAMSWGTIPKFWRANSLTYTYNGVNADVGLPTFTGTDFSNYTDNIRTYDILDIFNYYSITPDQPITIKPYGTSNYTLDNGESIGDNNFTKLRTSTYGSPGFMDDKWYCIYYPDSGLFDFYDKNDVKMQTSNVCYVSFCGSNARYGAIVDYNYNIIGYYDFGTTRPTPYLEISYTTETGGTTVYHYADITKGYSIKNDNITNVTWNNAYVNGVIELLFRAENTQTTYHNDIIVGDNNISIDYSSNRFYITLNGGDPVDIGTWRNIIVNIDLTNGYLSVIPVRTFNSYTNVVLDNTNIIVGNLINPVPTNIIEWQPTANSLDFNIYSTSVFMNSYGVVMVDPTLDVTQYFTNLDNFYQLRLSNFSIYGQSITINGVTGTVTGGTVTFNDETIQIKDMEITYADGNVVISDSYANIDLGAITDNTISMTGAWYFITELYSGYTTEKVIYDWDWSDFILDDKAFGVIYIGLCLIGLIVARKFFTMTITDYLLFIISIVIALTVPVIA